MMWLWLALVWLSLASAVGVLLGGALRAADRNDRVRCDVDRALGRELAEL